MEALLLGCKPINPRKDISVTLYLKDDEGIKPVEIKWPHTFCTKRLAKADADSLHRRLCEQFRDRTDVKIREKPSGKYVVIHAIGPRELKGQLPELFIKDTRCSPSQMLNWMLPDFSKVEIEPNENKMRLIGPASLEELLQLKPLAIDLELDKKGTENYIRINTAAIADEAGKGAMSIFDGYSQEKLINYVERHIQHKDPPIICSHNVAFDLLQPRDKVGTFQIGVDDSDPVIKGRVGSGKKKEINGVITDRKGFLKLEVAGRQLFCSMSYARNNLGCTNNKLETVSAFLDIDYKKSLDYGSLETLVQEAEKGDIIAREKIKAYCADDVQVHYELAKRLLPLALTEALAFETSLINVCFNGKSTLARKLRDKRYFEALGTYRGNRGMSLQDFDVYEEKLALLKGCKSIKSKRGCYGEPLIVVFPKFLERAFEKVLRNEPAAKSLVNAINNSNSAVDKVILHRDIEALCEEPLFDLQNYLRTKEAGIDKIFYGRYNRTDPKDLDRSVARELNALDELLKNANVEVINYSKRFLFLKPKGSLSSSRQVLQNSPLVEIYGMTDVAVSGHGGRIFASIDKKPISYELDIYGRKGLRTDFEREIYSYFLDFATNSVTKPELFTKLKSRFEELAQNKISKVDLIFYTNTELEPWEYSWLAQRHERVQAFNELGARKGSKLIFGYGIDKFGDKRRLRADDFFRDDVKVDIEAYQEKFFGTISEKCRNFPNGSISDIVYSICPAKKDYERQELMRFLKGRGDLTHWNVYNKHTQKALF